MPKQISTYTPEYAMTRLMDAISLVETEKEGWNTLRSCAKDLYQSVIGSQMSDHSLARLLKAEKPNNSPDTINYDNVHALMFPAPEMTIEEWINQPAPEGVLSITAMYEEAESILTKNHVCKFGSEHCTVTPCSACSTNNRDMKEFDKKHADRDTFSYPWPFYVVKDGKQYLVPAIPGVLQHSNSLPEHPVNGITGFWYDDEHYRVSMADYPQAHGDFYVACLLAIPVSVVLSDKFAEDGKRFYYAESMGKTPGFYSNNGLAMCLFPMEWMAIAHVRELSLLDDYKVYKFLGKHPDSNKTENSLK